MKDGIKKKDFLTDFEQMRIGAEQERKNRFNGLKD